MMAHDEKDKTIASLEAKNKRLKTMLQKFIDDVESAPVWDDRTAQDELVKEARGLLEDTPE